VKLSSTRRVTKVVPLVASVALLVTACGSSDDDQATAAQQPEAVVAAPAPEAEAAPAAEAPDAEAPAAKVAEVVKEVKTAKVAPRTEKAKTAAVTPSKGAGAKKAAAAETDVKGDESAAEQAANQKIYDEKAGATDTGITKDGIKLGSINMHGMALGNLVTQPMVRGNLASASAINDRGGVLGRRLSIVDCDDGPGEVSRAKACIKKLAVQDKIFSLVSGVDWATASIHDDLKQFKLPYIGAWAYSQTEWQDPYMFPSHMSMIHEAMAGANWVKNVIKPKTFGLICLTSPEMQLACKEVQKVLEASGAKLVKKADVSISETSMSSHVLAMRAANPDHIVH